MKSLTILRKIFKTKTRFSIEYIKLNKLNIFFSARRLFNVADARYTKQINHIKNEKLIGEKILFFNCTRAFFNQPYNIRMLVCIHVITKNVAMHGKTIIYFKFFLIEFFFFLKWYSAEGYSYTGDARLARSKHSLTSVIFASKQRNGSLLIHEVGVEPPKNLNRLHV